MAGRCGRRTAALVAVALATASCGARWTDEQKAAVASRADGRAVALEGASSDVTAAPSETPSGVAGGADGAGSTTPGGGTAAPGAPDGGATGSPGGGDQPAAADRPCAAPSSAPGVTGETITVGSISSLSGPVPGLGASAAAAARAHVAYRNATGGVCGRRIELKEADDGTDNGRYRSVVDQLGPLVLGIAGGFALGDVGGVEVVDAQQLPVVSNPGSEAFGELPTAFDLNPPYPDPDAVIGKYRYLHDDGARKVAMAYLAVDQSRAEARLQRRLMEAAGLRIVQVQELPLSTLSYDSAARSVANSGADYLFFIGDVNSNGSMARAMADTGYELRFAEYFAFSYGTQFVELAGPAAEGAMAWLRTLPNEDAPNNPEMAAFLEWMQRVAPSEVTDPFAADSWAATKAFFDALEGLPGPITRETLVAQLAGIGTYDAGGMLGPIELGVERTKGCFVGVQVRSGRWERLTPQEGFLC